MLVAVTISCYLCVVFIALKAIVAVAATILFYLGVPFLALKAVDNLKLSYRIAVQPIIINEVTGTTDPISLEIGFDLLFLIWCLLFLPLSDEHYLPFGKLSMAVGCIALPVLTLGQFVAALFVIGWIRTRLNRKKPKG